MRIVIDTNIVVSGIFFGGLPRKILEAVADGKIQAIASNEILEEYEKVFEAMVKKKICIKTLFELQLFSFYFASLVRSSLYSASTSLQSLSLTSGTEASSGSSISSLPVIRNFCS